MRALRDHGKAGRRKAARPLPAVLRDAFSAQFSLFFFTFLSRFPLSESAPVSGRAIRALHFIFPSESSTNLPGGPSCWQPLIIAAPRSLKFRSKSPLSQLFSPPLSPPLLISKKLLCRKARMLFSVPLPKDYYHIRGQHEDGARRGIFGFGRVISCLPWQQSITKIRSS